MSVWRLRRDGNLFGGCFGTITSEITADRNQEWWCTQSKRGCVSGNHTARCLLGATARGASTINATLHAPTVCVKPHSYANRCSLADESSIKRPNPPTSTQQRLLPHYACFLTHKSNEALRCYFDRDKQIISSIGTQCTTEIKVGDYVRKKGKSVCYSLAQISTAKTYHSITAAVFIYVCICACPLSSTFSFVVPNGEVSELYRYSIGHRLTSIIFDLTTLKEVIDI